MRAHFRRSGACALSRMPKSGCNSATIATRSPRPKFSKWSFAFGLAASPDDGPKATQNAQDVVTRRLRSRTLSRTRSASCHALISVRTWAPVNRSHRRTTSGPV
jgi:hypothetical protein